MSEFPVDSAIVSAAIAAIISIAVFFYKERKVEPQKWKRDMQAQTLLKQIKAHGKLLNFLDAAEARKKALPTTGTLTQVGETDTHIFLLPDHEIQFNKIFRENTGYFSNELNKLYGSLIESDRNWDLSEKKWKENQSSWIHGVNLSEIHNVVRNQFHALRKQYEEMTDFKFE
ncbi:MAG: hypothetical protein KGL95_09840 [Patescibacteria group bacterium]|nr:hypothetical protein [Patescibacteria group bacterium]